MSGMRVHEAFASARIRVIPRLDIRCFTRWTKTLPTVSLSPEGNLRMRSLRRSRLPADVSVLPSWKRTAVPISCPDCQNGLTRRSKTRGLVESLLAFLQVRPCRCEASDFRFLRRSAQHAPKTTRPPGRTYARDCQRIMPPETSNGGHTPHPDMD